MREKIVVFQKSEIQDISIEKNRINYNDQNLIFKPRIEPERFENPPEKIKKKIYFMSAILRLTSNNRPELVIVPDTLL